MTVRRQIGATLQRDVVCRNILSVLPNAELHHAVVIDVAGTLLVTEHHVFFAHEERCCTQAHILKQLLAEAEFLRIFSTV